MTSPLLDVRVGLRLHIHTVPGSSRIRWWLPGCESCMFDPADGPWHPYEGDVQTVLSAIPAEDLVLIEACLRRHDAEPGIFTIVVRLASRLNLPGESEIRRFSTGC